MASRIEDAKVAIGLDICRVKDNLIRETLRQTFFIHLGPITAPWVFDALLARIRAGP
jgi:hypothetical protein